jgi:ATP-dependent RNA helicase RhlE
LETLPTLTFDTLGLSPPTLDALRRAGYEHPTPIQQRAIPPALTGQDVIGCAATGTGKTAAFVLPMVERLKGRPGTHGLVLAPTRELAIQIAEHLTLFGHPQHVRGAVVIGGTSMPAQVDALRRHPAVIVATPGRLVDHIQQKTVSLAQIEILVLDEADRMLDMGFKPQLVRILAALPKKRQTLLFSATMAGEVSDFARTHLTNPARVEVNRSGTTSARASQAIYTVPQLDKPALLLGLLEADENSMLVFTRTKRRADKVARVLERAGHRVARIHADRSQGQRRQALEGFKAGRYRVLVATDIAARGIDVEEIGHVVNFDLPHVPEDYVHRIGRTARAGAAGAASSFVAPEEMPLLRDIERFTRTNLERRPLPEQSAAYQAELARTRHARANPGPPQSSHGNSGRPSGQPPGRHARTHPKHNKKPQSSSAAPRTSSGHAPSHGTWRPQRRR